MILLIDNYDSFSYNLFQMVGEMDPDIKVIRNDAMTLEEIRAFKAGTGDPFSRSRPARGCRNHPAGGEGTG